MGLDCSREEAWLLLWELAKALACQAPGQVANAWRRELGWRHCRWWKIPGRQRPQSLKGFQDARQEQASLGLWLVSPTLPAGKKVNVEAALHLGHGWQQKLQQIPWCKWQMGAW